MSKKQTSALEKIGYQKILPKNADISDYECISIKDKSGKKTTLYRCISKKEKI